MRRSLAPLALALVTSAAPALAQEPARGEELFLEGRAALARGDLDTACARFADSAAVGGAVGPLLNLADCEERRGRVATALNHWRSGAARLPEGDDRLPLAKSRIALLEGRVPRVTLVAGGAPPTATAALDGRPVGIGREIEVDPGEHLLVVRASGHRPGETRITLNEREHKAVPLVVGPRIEQSPAPTPAPRQSDRRDTTQRNLAFVVGGVGLAGLAMAGITGALVVQQDGIVEDNCDANRRCNQDGADAAATGRTLLVVNTIGFVVGALGIGAGVVLFATAPTTSGVSASATARF